jgi:hypothetical protein
MRVPTIITGWARVIVLLFGLFPFAAMTSAAASGGVEDACDQAGNLEPDVMVLPGLFEEDEVHQRGLVMAIGSYCVQYWDAVRESMFGLGGIRVVKARDGAIHEAFWQPMTYLRLWFEDSEAGFEIGDDLTGNGLPNLVVRMITGGDCCFALLILEFGDGVRVIYDDREQRDGEATGRAFRDLTGDGRMEIVVVNGSGARWTCLNGAGIDLVRVSVWRYEPTFGDERRGAYVLADPTAFPEVFEWYLARGRAILAYDGSYPFNPNYGPGMVTRALETYYEEPSSDLQRACAVMPLGMALVDAGRNEEARALLPEEIGESSDWPWRMAAVELAAPSAANDDRGTRMFERLTCPSDEAFGVVARIEHGGHLITGWAFTEGRDDLLGAIRIDLADGRTWCFSRVGGYVTLATGPGEAPVDLTGSGHPDVLIQVHGLRTCEQFAYVIELAPEPRVVFRAESWIPDRRSSIGHPVCPFVLADIDRDGRFELVTSDSFWTNPGVTIPTCSHALTPYVPVALSYGDGTFRVVDPLNPTERIPAWALASLHNAVIGALLRAYAETAVTASGPRFETEHRCVVAGAVLPWFYLRQPDHARAVFDVLYQLDDGDAIWARVVESVGASPYVGEWYR